MKNLVYALLMLFLIGCATTTPIRKLKFAQSLSPTKITFKEPLKQLVHIIEQIDTTYRTSEGWDITEKLDVFPSRGDTTHFTDITIQETEWLNMKSNEKVRFRTKSRFEGRLYFMDSVTVVEGIKANYSNDGVPSGYYNAGGRYVFGGIEAKSKDEDPADYMLSLGLQIEDGIEKLKLPEKR
jgi:hypothetical protein